MGSSLSCWFRLVPYIVADNLITNRQSDYQYFFFLDYYYLLVGLIFLFLIFIHYLYM